MNKIILSGDKLDLDKYSESAQIIVKEDSILNAINLNLNYDLDIHIEKGVTLTFNIFDYSIGQNINLHFTNDDNSKLILNSAFISENKYELNIDCDLFGNGIEADINIRGINEEHGTVKINMNGQVAGETHDNILSEYAKIINHSDESAILIPNLIVNTCDVTANHGVSIGSFSDEELFYVMSKGISKFTAKRMLETGFLLTHMDDDNKEKIKNILIGR